MDRALATVQDERHRRHGREWPSGCRRTCPVIRRPSVIHGDFKLDNVMLDRADPGRLTAVLDWEMCALGDPLVDLGILLTYWSHTTRPVTRTMPSPR